MNVPHGVSAPVPNRFPHLDMLRGLASIAVCVGHARAFLMVDYDSSSATLASKTFYFLTGRHHQAVMIFFALSGFLVGGSILRAHRRGDWSWQRYLVQRICRLWIVMIPALLLTFLWDSAGAAIDPAAYSGALWSNLKSGPQPSQPMNLSFTAFVANLLFLQTILAPTYGSNGPFWSLANEFWYYMLFPICVCAWQARNIVMRGVWVLLALTLAMILPFGILAYFTIWLAGAAAGAMPTDGNDRAVRFVGVWGAVCAAFAVVASVRWGGWQTDFAAGVATSVSLPWLARLKPFGRAYCRSARALSEVSYTLYLSHFPMLMFLYVWLVAPSQFRVGPEYVVLLVGTVAAAWLYASAVWLLFERNTDKAREFVQRLMFRRFGGSAREAI